MSRLSDLINKALGRSVHKDGTIDTDGAVSAIVPTLTHEDRDVLVKEALTLRVRNAAKSSKSSILALSRKRNLELPFEGLHGAYPLDLGDRYIRRTESLTRAEFQRVISIREKQIVDDSAHLKRLRDAFDVMAPIWDAHPNWTVAQCVAALAKAAAA